MHRPEADTGAGNSVELSRFQSEFLSGVSHQLRTPINAILGVTHLALAQADSEQQRQYLISIQTTSRQLMHSVNNLLDLSQLEQGTLALAPTNFQLQSLLDDLTQDVNTRLVKRAVVFTLTTDERIPATLNGDASRLKQLISCFIDNAIKFTQQGEIRLQVRLAARNRKSVRLHFTIEDTGSGLPPGLGMALFRNSEKLFEVGSSENPKKGIGLRIARLLAQLMNGDAGMITPHSPGAAFWFTVQLRPAQTAEQIPTEHRLRQKALSASEDSDRQAGIAEVLPPPRRPLPGTDTSAELLLADLQQRLLLEDFSCLELARRHAATLENHLGTDAIRLHSALHDFDFTRARVILGGAGEA
ncbi:MAG: sensor histidine kinase [Marinobacterium sp.]